MRISLIGLLAATLAAAIFILVVPNWHLPVPGTQVSLRGPSMVQFAPTAQQLTAPDTAPAPVPPPPPDPRPATTAFKNVQVLTDMNAGDFLHLQHAITEWVSPKAGCGFCHAGDDYASDAKPGKQVARVMLRMTRHVNTAWSDHVGASGVTCYTCHRGQPVPSQVWFPSPPRPTQPFVDKQEDWNEDAVTVREFFPRAGWDEYLLQDTPGLAQSYTALPSGGVAAQVVVKRLYEFMMQMSDGIGVNCGYCHNSRAFFDWDESTPARWTGYSGIEMTRDLNRNFLLAVPAILPQSRIRPGQPRMPLVPLRETGAQTGNALAVCATCHHGVPRPLAGADMLESYPGLRGPDANAGVPTPLPPHS